MVPGATGATFVVANGIRAFNFNPKWLTLLIAQIIAASGVYLSGGKGSDYFVGVVNGFLISCTATGATAASSQAAQGAIQRGAGVSAVPRNQRLSVELVLTGDSAVH